MSIEKVATITSIVAGALTCIAIIIVAAVCFARLVIKARRADSDGGKTITPEEWKKIITALLPFGAKLLSMIQSEKKQEEEKTPAPQEKVEVSKEAESVKPETQPPEEEKPVVKTVSKSPVRDPFK